MLPHTSNTPIRVSKRSQPRSPRVDARHPQAGARHGRNHVRGARRRPGGDAGGRAQAGDRDRHFRHASDQLRVFVNPEILAGRRRGRMRGRLPVGARLLRQGDARGARSACARRTSAAKPFELDADGLLAVCIQHEMDHLVGKVFVEYLSPLKRARLAAQGSQEAAARRLTARRLPMRVGFAGTPDVRGAARSPPSTTRGYTIPLVLTQPDRPSGRGMAITPSPVKRFALAHGAAGAAAAVAEADAACDAQLSSRRLDVLVVAAYGLILPQAVLDWPRLGCLNIHASLLPRWRGAAPIARAIDAGDRETRRHDHADGRRARHGPMIVAARVPIGARDNRGLAARPARRRSAPRRSSTRCATLADGERSRRRRSPPRASRYAHKIDARGGRRSTGARRRGDRSARSRAFDPCARRARRRSTARAGQAVARGAAASRQRCDRRGARDVVRATAPPGIDVACGGGVLRVDEVQPAVRRRDDCRRVRRADARSRRAHASARSSRR